MFTDTYGSNWATGDTADTLRSTIWQLKEDYHRFRDIEYSRDPAFGYPTYHPPASYATIQYVIADLLDAALIDHSLTVLDIGAGVGGPALGIHDVCFGAPNRATDHDTPALVSYTAVEPSDATTILARFLGETTRNFHYSIEQTPIEPYEYTHEYNLIVFSNVLSELKEPAVVLDDATDALAPDGAIIAVAPADKHTSQQLRQLERTVTNDLTVFSPTIRLWPERTPMNRCWSFDVKPDLHRPTFQHQLDAPIGAHGEFINTDVQYSYVILRKDGKQRISFTPTHPPYHPFGESHNHVTERVTSAAIKLSHDLGDENPVFLVGDGSEQTDHFCVLATTTPRTRPMVTADYGELLIIEHALLLWNDDEEAFNLVLDDQTTIIQPD
jgi:SAM-dependent methyltransferase